MSRHPVADELLREGPMSPVQQPSGMTAEQLMRLERRIEALKERGHQGENVGEQLRELRRDHYLENGASGG